MGDIMKKIIIVLLVLILCGCSYDPYEMPKDVILKVKNDDINVYSKVKIKDLIKDKNVKIINKNKYINTNKVKKYNTEIEYEYKKRKYKYKVNYNVVDREKPMLVSYLSNRTILLNDTTDFCEKISYIDNYDRKPKCEIDGEIDFSKTGTYYLNYVLTDKNNNQLIEPFTVNIVESIKENNNSYNNQKTNFSDIVNNYKNDNTMIGIDVSAWQGDIDYKKIKENGCEFVIIRMAYSSNINEDLKLDMHYKENIKKAKKAGLKVGIYFYTNAASKKEVKKQAKFILKNLKKTKLDFPIAYDFESFGNINDYNVNTHDLDELFITFKNEVKKKGYDAMLYSSKYYLEKIWLNNSNSKVWLAHYTNETTYEGKYKFWQLSNTGNINGIYGDVDIDIYYKRELN